MGADIFDEKNELQPQSVNWGKIGDHIMGTKVGQRENIKTMFGDNVIFEVKTTGGVFHTKEGVEVTIKPDEFWGVWGRGDIFDAQVRRMQIGQKFGLKFTETKPSGKGNDAKIVKVYTTGEMDTAWLEGQAGSGVMLPLEKA